MAKTNHSKQRHGKSPDAQQRDDSGEAEPETPDSAAETRGSESASEAEEEASRAAGSGGSEPESSQETSALLEKLDQLSAEREDYRQRMLRSVADFENYRRRMAREKDDVRAVAAAGLVEDLLPVLDNLKLGLDAAREHHPEAKSVLDGIGIVQTQFEQVLEQHGLEAIEPLGAEFDPNFHEAVSHQPSDAFAEGKVSFVQRIGYKLRDRLLRPAVVVVSSGPASEVVSGSESANQEGDSERQNASTKKGGDSS